MTKLYYTPTSCGASSFICAYISRLDFECEVVDLATHTTESGIDFYSINPKGNVPCIVLDDGSILNENISCLEYIADISNSNLAPKQRTIERYKLNQLLSFLASELHSSIGMFFNPNSKDIFVRTFLKSVFDKKMEYLQKNILNDDKKFVFGDKFTIVDSYLHIILSWLGYVGLNLNDYPIANKYYNGICNIDIVKKAKNRMATIPKVVF
jgi:glutathione S-transferase